MTTFREIGKGTFGVIFTDDTHSEAGNDVACVLKRTIQPNIDPRNWLQQDASQHQAISQALMKVTADEHLQRLVLPCVPRFFGTIRSEYAWWSLCGNARPWLTALEGGRCQVVDDVYSEPSPLLSAQRIPNVATTVTRKLLDEYCQDIGQDPYTGAELLSDTSILLRIYFGQKAPVRTGSRLQNFPLYRDRLESILSKPDYAKAVQVMASALAFLHWCVRCDAKDVEFVFGGLNPLAKEQECPIFELFGEQCHMWLLDFNQVETITMNAQGVDQAVLGYENDPYYPKPGESVEDWEMFKNHYLNASQAILQTSSVIETQKPTDIALLELPRIFIERIETNAGLNRGQRALDFGLADNAGPRITLALFWKYVMALWIWK